MIQTNPFYLLNIPMNASKGVIAAAAEALQLGAGQFDGDETLNLLLSPDARVEAEISWFPGEPEDTVQDIRYAVRTSSLIVTDRLRGLSRLNAELYNFGIELVRADSRNLAGFYADKIWDIAVYSSQVNAADVLEAINRERNDAGIAAAAEDRVREALDMRSKDISEELYNLLANSISEEMNRAIVCNLADNIVSRGDMRIRTVINDIVDRYEAGHFAELHEFENRISELATKIIACNPANSAGVTLLCGQLKIAAAGWAEAAEPMLIRADRMNLNYTEGSVVRDAVYDVIVSVGDDKTFDTHYARAIAMSKDMRVIFAANHKFAEPFDTIARDADDRTRRSRDTFRRGGCFRAFLGIFAATGLFYAAIILTMFIDSDIPHSEAPGYVMFGIINAVVFILSTWQIIMSVKRQREYEKENGGDRPPDKQKQENHR